MAVEEQRSWPAGNAGPGMRMAAGALGERLGSLARGLRDAWRVVTGYWPLRAVLATIGRRIFFANLLGLAVLVVGIPWLSQHQAGLIAAKNESLRIQGEIIASAIASSALVDRGRIAFDPERLPEVEGLRLPYRDDGFAAMELSMRPDRVVPVLRRLIHPTHNTRARIYERSGRLIVDSQDLSAPPPAPEPAKAGDAGKIPPADEIERVSPRNVWTRFTELFGRSELPVYREIGRANGTSYPEVRQALRGTGLPPMLLLTEKNEKIISLAIPIQRRNAVLGVLLLSTRPGEIDEILKSEQRIILALTALALLATLLAAMLLARSIAGPLRRLSEGAENVSQSITARADLPQFGNRSDEIGQLSDSIGRMTASLYNRIEASEKFAADVAHELKNPLTAAQSTAQLLHYAKTPAAQEEVVKQLLGELGRLNRLITDISMASRIDAQMALQTTTQIDVRTVLEEMIGSFRGRFEGQGVTLALDVPEVPEGTDPFVIMGNAGRIEQVVTNLLDNALSFSPASGRVVVRLRRRGPNVDFVVSDEGPGIPEDSIDRIFDRFYSDRPQSDQSRGKNSGLGLSISREIINAHDGRIWAENRVDNDRVVGARLRVSLPAAHSRNTRRRGRRVPVPA